MNTRGNLSSCLIFKRSRLETLTPKLLHTAFPSAQIPRTCWEADEKTGDRNPIPFKKLTCRDVEATLP